MSMEKKEKDIFDKIISAPCFRAFKPLYIKYKQMFLYLFFGGTAFFLNIVLFVGLEQVFRSNELVNNAICWIVCVLFQFFTNRTWVFDGYVDSFAKFMKQMGTFLGGRIFTLIVEEMILAIFILWLGFHAISVKLAAQIIVIILNYIISKWVVFAHKEAQNQ